MDGLFSSHKWAKIVVLLLSLKIPHARLSIVPSCSDAHDFPGYPCVNVAVKLLSIKRPIDEHPEVAKLWAALISSE